jgi:hypothetical protein
MKKLLRSWIESLYEATESWSGRKYPVIDKKQRTLDYLDAFAEKVAEGIVKDAYAINVQDDPFYGSAWYVCKKYNGIVCDRPFEFCRDAERSIRDYEYARAKEWVAKNQHKIEVPSWWH